jgi:predicted metalloprotease with PDZ domain
MVPASYSLPGMRILPLLALMAAAWSAQCRATTADYQVEVNAERPRLAMVSATIEPGERGLCMTRDAADTGLTHGWATFVHDLHVADAHGSALAANYDGAGCWRVAAKGPVTAHYAMLLQHDRFPNEPGDDELAYAGDWGQFWTGRALFLEGAPASDVRVTFRLPQDWQVTAPWPAASAPGEYRPADVDALLENGFMLGRQVVRRIADAGAHVQIGLAGKGPEARADEVAGIVRSSLAAFTDLHRAPPDGELVVFLGQGRLLGGGVIGQTISMLVENELPDEMLPTLAYIVTHEVFHLWNARLEYDDERDFYWFTEGFAEYYTFRQMLAAGLWDEATQRSQFAERAELYRSKSGSLSLRAAGQHKLENYDLVYSGGLMAAAALDGLIRKQSRGRHRLDDLLPLLMQQHRRGSGKALTMDALIARIREATGVDAGPFIRHCVIGNETITPPIRLP